MGSSLCLRLFHSTWSELKELHSSIFHRCRVSGSQSAYVSFRTKDGDVMRSNCVWLMKMSKSILYSSHWIIFRLFPCISCVFFLFSYFVVVSIVSFVYSSIKSPSAHRSWTHSKRKKSFFFTCIKSFMSSARKLSAEHGTLRHINKFYSIETHSCSIQIENRYPSRNCLVWFYLLH